MNWNNLELPDNPYYQDDAVVIYNGDCREILPDLPKVDLVLTDPPYGVGLDYLSYEDTRENWLALIDYIIPWGLEHAGMMIMPCSRIVELKYIYDHFPPDWLICWYKGSPGTSAWTGFNDWEPHLVYGKNNGVQFHDYFYAQPETNGTIKHPCPKPLKWGLYLISKTTKGGDLVCDPFLGSGTTAFCAKKLNRKCIGIEIEERYCEIAAKRCCQTVMNFDTLKERRR